MGTARVRRAVVILEIRMIRARLNLHSPLLLVHSHFTGGPVHCMEEEERQLKRHKLDPDKLHSSHMAQRMEVQTILSIQELDDVLFESFRNLPTSSTSLIDFVEDAFDEFRKTLFTIEELHNMYDHTTTEEREPHIHFIDDPDYISVGEASQEKQQSSFTWDWSSNKMVEKK